MEEYKKTARKESLSEVLASGILGNGVKLTK